MLETIKKQFTERRKKSTRTRDKNFGFNITDKNRLLKCKNGETNKNNEIENNVLFGIP